MSLDDSTTTSTPPRHDRHTKTDPSHEGPQPPRWLAYAKADSCDIKFITSTWSPIYYSSYTKPTNDDREGYIHKDTQREVDTVALPAFTHTLGVAIRWRNPLTKASSTTHSLRIKGRVVAWSADAISSVRRRPLSLLKQWTLNRRRGPHSNNSVRINCFLEY